MGSIQQLNDVEKKKMKTAAAAATVPLLTMPRFMVI